MIKRTAIRLGLTVGFPLLFAPVAGSAADLVAGEMLADRWCAQCHGVRPKAAWTEPFRANILGIGGRAFDYQVFASRIAKIAARDDTPDHLHA
jgi:mono/diheme cytochrome c family protein